MIPSTLFSMRHNMELLDRYLHAVGFWLPKAQKKDIIAELSEDIRSEVEDKEAGLGRKLSDDELAAILKRRGSPFAVAQLYLPQRQPIELTLGPVWQSFRQGYYAAIAVLVVVGLALACVNLARPYWTRVRLGVRAAVNAASAVILFVVLAAHGALVKA
jgi:hypothetical protein